MSEAETLLINPPYQAAVRSVAQTTVGPPMGLAYLAGAMLRDGLRVHIHDANALGWSIQTTIREAWSVRPDVIGLTASTATIDMAAEIALGLRHVGFEGPILIGGAHATALPRETLARYPAFTVAVQGEAEERIGPLVRALTAGSGAVESLHGIAGVAWRNGDVVGLTPPPAHPPDVSRLAPPARHLLPEDRYYCPDGATAGTVIANRGCPAPCSYCSVPAHFGHKLRRRTPEDVADEVLELADRGMVWINFIDDTFTWDEQWTLDVCAAFQARGLPARIQWQCLTRVDRVSETLLRTMKAAGCARIELGIEVGSPEGIKVLRKKIDRNEVLQAFRLARAAGLETLAFAMVNVPGETLDDIQMTRDLVLEADPDWLQLSYCTPYPGTVLYQTALAEGRLRSTDWADYRFLRRPVLDNGVLTEEAVIAAHQRLLRAFWLRPRVVARMALRLATKPQARKTTLRAALAGLRSIAR